MVGATETMAAQQPLLVDINDGVAFLTLNRPQQYNSLTAALLEALHEAFERLDGREDARDDCRGDGSRQPSSAGGLLGAGGGRACWDDRR